MPSGVHEPLALRTVVQLEVEGGVIGFGEGWGEAAILVGSSAVRSALVGRSVLAIIQIEPPSTRSSSRPQPDLDHGATAPSSPRSRSPATTRRASSLGLPVSDLLGGAVRDRVHFSAYLFYKWAGHPAAPSPDDEWGAAARPSGHRSTRPGR